MNKFLIILRKELKDIFTLQTFLPLVVICVVFYFMGDFMTDLMSSSGNTKDIVVAVMNNDDSTMSENVIEQMKTLMTVVETNAEDPQTAFEQLKNYELADGKITQVKILAVFEQGFGDKLDAKNQGSAEIKLYTHIDSFGVMSMVSQASVSAIIDAMNSAISNQLMNDITAGQNIDLNFVKNPIVTTNYTLLNNHIENISPSEIQGYISSQTMFIPIIVFVVLMMASQSIATSMATEKGDKTLETLMTTPVSRITVLFAKMLAAAISAIIFTLFYMFAMQNFMGSMYGSNASPEFVEMLKNFGIAFDTMTFIIVGVQLFLSILCGLSIALILGIMAEDVKNLQMMIMPIMIVLMIPYLISMFTDIDTLPIIGRSLLYLIPFTHTFTATTNMFTQDYTLLIGGMIYQFVFVCAMMFTAVKIFNSDKLFTLGAMLKAKGGKKSTLPFLKK